MKQLIMLLFLVAGTTIATNAQTSTTKKGETPKTEQKQLKNHVCTADCKTTGKCTPVCGEKGHACTAECKKASAASSKMELKDHVCTENCHKSGKCGMMHGEKGHICSGKCKM